MKLKEKAALITGGAGGLGKAMALAMAKEGARVVVCDINQERLAEAAQVFEKQGAECLGICCDVSRSEDVTRMFQQIVAQCGTVHILVNNAAIVPNRPADEERRLRHYAYLTTPMPRQSLGITQSITDEDWHRYWGVNVHGVFYCTREALKLMEPQKYGKIINISSTGGISAMSAHSPHYSASKGAVVAFTKAVALDVAGANIYVNCIAPGAVHTPDWDEVFARWSPEQLNSLFQLAPLGRFGKPEEYAALAVYLASDENYCVGQIISPNGGLVI